MTLDLPPMPSLKLPLVSLVLVCLSGTAAAQQPYLSMAPLRIHAEAIGAEETGTALVGIDRSVPLHFFLPNVGRTSRVDVAAVFFGARNTAERTCLRYRLTAMELSISRAPWNGGVRLLSYDRSGTRDVVADWLAIQAGPSGHFRVGIIDVEPRIELSGSIATRRTGRAVFDDLPERAYDGATGVAGSLAAVATVAFAQSGYLEARGSIERFSAGDRPEHRSASIALHWTPATRFEVVARAAMERAFLSVPSTAKIAGLSIRFTPAAQAY